MKLELTTEQVNQILNALAQQPYIEVHELIATIQEQGSSQLNQSNIAKNTKVNVPIPEKGEKLIKNSQA